MTYLLDTHIVLWAFFEAERIPQKIAAIIADKSNRVVISTVSLMKIAIKLKVNKLTKFETTIAEFVTQIRLDEYELMPISIIHIQSYQNLPLFPEHRDPFDRFILSTALAEGFTVISADKNFKLYSDVVSPLAC